MTTTAELLAVVCHSSLPWWMMRTAVFYSTVQNMNTANAKQEVIRWMLYPPNICNRPSPTGAWCPDAWTCSSACHSFCIGPWNHWTCMETLSTPPSQKMGCQAPAQVWVHVQGDGRVGRNRPYSIQEGKQERGPEGKESCWNGGVKRQTLHQEAGNWVMHTGFIPHQVEGTDQYTFARRLATWTETFWLSFILIWYADLHSLWVHNWLFSILLFIKETCLFTRWRPLAENRHGI